MSSLRVQLVFVAMALALISSGFGQSSNSSDNAKGKPTPALSATASPTATSTPAPTSTPKTTGSKKNCSLPEDYLLTSSTSSRSSSTNSPEKGPGPLNAICHNGQILCLPPNAYQAHLQHGDTPVDHSCSSEGNQGTCP